MITPEASRAARGLLNWSLKVLAEKAGVAFTTISQFENGRPAYGTTAEKIAAAFVADSLQAAGMGGNPSSLMSGLLGIAGLNQNSAMINRSSRSNLWTPPAADLSCG